MKLRRVCRPIQITISNENPHNNRSHNWTFKKPFSFTEKVATELRIDNRVISKNHLVNLEIQLNQRRSCTAIFSVKAPQKWQIEHTIDFKKDTHFWQKLSMEILVEDFKPIQGMKPENFQSKSHVVVWKRQFRIWYKNIQSCTFRKRWVRISRYVWTKSTFANSGISGFHFRCRDHILQYLEFNSPLQVSSCQDWHPDGKNAIERIEDVKVRIPRCVKTKSTFRELCSIKIPEVQNQKIFHQKKYSTSSRKQ